MPLRFGLIWSDDHTHALLNRKLLTAFLLRQPTAVSATVIGSAQHIFDSTTATLRASTTAMLGALKSYNEFMKAKMTQVAAMSVSMEALAKRIDDTGALGD